MDSRIHDSGFIDYTRTGVFRVKRQRSIVYSTDRGDQVWARPGEYVRLNPSISAYLQSTRQFDRLEQVDEEQISKNTPILTEATAPQPLRHRMAQLASAVARPVKGSGQGRVSEPAKAPKAPEAKDGPTEAEREAAEDAADIAAADEAHAEWEAGGKKTLSADEARAELGIADSSPEASLPLGDEGAASKTSRKRAAAKPSKGQA